ADESSALAIEPIEKFIGQKIRVEWAEDDLFLPEIKPTSEERRRFAEERRQRLAERGRRSGGGPRGGRGAGGPRGRRGRPPGGGPAGGIDPQHRPVPPRARAAAGRRPRRSLARSALRPRSRVLVAARSGVLRVEPGDRPRGRPGPARVLVRGARLRRRAVPP